MQANAKRRRRRRVMKDWNIKRFTKAQPKNAFYQMARPARELFDHRPGATITKCCKDSHDL
jgi:hypothetical protein